MAAPSGTASVLSAKNPKGGPVFSFGSRHRSPNHGGFVSDESESEEPTRPKEPKPDTSNLTGSHVPASQHTTFPNSTHKTPFSSIPPRNNAASKQPILQHDMATEAEAQELISHLALLKTATGQQDSHELAGTPIFTMPVLKHSRHLFSQYGFLAGISDILERDSTGEEAPLAGTPSDPRLFFNISAPSSAFICGSQGSGKSHTLSCLLENCLMKSPVSKLDNPLAGLVFHYDSFTSDLKGSPCEAAYLASNPNIKVRVLCSPTNLQTIKRTYLGMNVQIEPLRINQSDLNTKRMMDLMAVSQDDGRMPLYLHAINRILRDMRMVQQQTNGSFNYAEFKRLVDDTPMTPGQLGPLTQRLETLESFMPKSQVGYDIRGPPGQTKKKSQDLNGNDWTIKPGSLTIVDLSCPCVTPEGACALFNMCLSLFLEQKTSVGRVVALDEAHKYMNSASEATALTNTLLSSIRLQRHLGTRVFISTQEPTISPKLLDLCSFTIVHRFSSPDWLKCLKLHLAALDIEEDSVHTQKTKMIGIFNQIVKLRVGEALLFAPSATIGIDDSDSLGLEQPTTLQPKMDRLGLGYLRIKIRGRITTDGGKSILATGTGTPPFNLNSGGVSMSKTPLFGAASLKSFVPIFETEAHKVAASTPTFGAPSPTPRVFDGLRAAAPIVPAVETLKTRGTLGLNHTPPVTRAAPGPFNVKLPAVANPVQGTADKNIFGVLRYNAASATNSHSQNHVFGSSSAGGLSENRNTLTLQENRKPNSEGKKIENVLPFETTKTSNLSNSVFAGLDSNFVPAISSFVLENKPADAFAVSPATQAVFCPGTRSAMFIPFMEIEVSSNCQHKNSFQHICTQKTFLDFSQEELRLADYALAPMFTNAKVPLFGTR